MKTSTKIKPTAESDRIIRGHVWASVGIGLIPVPIVDFMGLTGIQINMLRKIAGLYEVPFFKDAVKNILSSMIGGALPTAVSTPLAISMFKVFPIMGQTAGIVAMPVAGGATTYAIGKVFVRHFDSGGTFLSFDSEKVKGYYAEMFKEGETIAADIKDKKSNK
ncbi:DUF697 domain-containing protein [Desulfobacterales bacterium HSG2]|nr:DUF697 domain-containing protein [Desulfobacterales bacterium HSG2]